MRYLVLVTLFCGAFSLHIDPASSPAYSEDLARKFLVIAGAPYCYQSKLHNLSDWSTLSQPCTIAFPDFQVVKQFYNETIDAFAFVGISNKEKIIAYSVKGTDPSHIADILIDLGNIFTYPANCSFGPTKVHAHQGFCEEFMALSRLGFIDSIVSLKRQYSTYQVVGTGHSLGAAVATLAYLDLTSTHNIPVLAYTYGQPRAGASRFASLIYDQVKNKKKAGFFRVTHYRDAIAHAPPCKVINNICQQDDLHPYHTGFQMHYNEKMDQYQKCSTVDGADCNETFDLSITDHLYYFGYRVSEICCADGG